MEKFILFLVIYIIGLSLFINYDFRKFKPIQRVIETNYLQPYYIRENGEYGKMKLPRTLIETIIRNVRGQHLNYTNIIIVNDNCWDIDRLKQKEITKAKQFIKDKRRIK